MLLVRNINKKKIVSLLYTILNRDQMYLFMTLICVNFFSHCIVYIAWTNASVEIGSYGFVVLYYNVDNERIRHIDLIFIDSLVWH